MDKDLLENDSVEEIPPKKVPIRHMARETGKLWHTLLVVFVIPLVIAGMVTGITWVATDPAFREPPAAKPIPVFTPNPDPTPTAAPTDIPDVVSAAAMVTRIEIPYIKFDSNNVVLPPGQVDTIEPWTFDDNRDHNGQLTPGAFESSIKQDLTVPGGGLVGTDTLATTNPLIAGHTTPYYWEKLGVFQPMINVIVGNTVAFTTPNGRMCYVVTGVDNTTSKSARVMVGEVEMSAVDAKYRYATPIPGRAYIVTCYRPDVNSTGPTTENLVLILQFNQDLTNTGQC